MLHQRFVELAKPRRAGRPARRTSHKRRHRYQHPRGVRGWPSRIRGWAVWSLPRRSLVLLLGVIAAAGAVLGASLVEAPTWTTDTGERAALLLGLGVISSEVGRWSGHQRPAYASTSAGRFSSWRRFTGIWVFAGAVVLPWTCAVCVAALLGAHRILRPERHDTAHRQLYLVATYVLATALIGAALILVGADTSGVSLQFAVVLILALALYAVVHVGLVALAVRLSVAHHGRSTTWSGRQELGLEGATLSLGAITALLVLSPNSWMAVFLLPPLAFLSRTASAVERSQTADDTVWVGSLMSPEAWYRRAQRAIHRATRRRRPVAVLLIAIDQIPEIVRRHGGDAGQAVLDALGARLRERAPADELYGRSDAQHIAVLLPSTSDVDARIAEITAAVAGAEFHIRAPGSSNPVHVDTLTPSFGVARLHEDGNDTEDLLAAAVLDLNSTAARSQSVTSGTAPHLPASLHAFWAQRLGRDETP